MTRWLKAAEQYFPVVLFIMQHKVVLAFQSSDEILKCGYSNEMCREHFFVVLLFFIMLYKVVLTLETVDKNLKCVHSNKSYQASSTFRWDSSFSDNLQLIFEPHFSEIWELGLFGEWNALLKPFIFWECQS